MFSEALPLLYLVVLLALLGGSGWVLVRQILKSRRMEIDLGHLQQKLSREKGTAREHFELGSIFLSKKLYSRAVQELQQVFKAETSLEDPRDLARAYNALGYAYFAQQQYDLAIRNYKQALEAAPDYLTAMNNLGHAYEEKKLEAQALAIYEQALTQDSKNSTALRRAEVLRRRVNGKP